MYTNRLADEKSPYLLQHAHNPVDWYPWGEAAFAKARQEDRPIFLSVGYSTCHWCHVMERESFESEDIAAVLNRFFVPVKVDREERPDVDRIYMAFVQATTQSGGWPMSVWLTPDLKPFYGGTYFPPDGRWGRPGFKQILEHIANAWLSDRPRITQSSRDILDELKRHTSVGAGGSNWVDSSIADSCYQVFRRTFDSAHGGFGHAPKFPRPVAFDFLLRHHARTGNRDALQMCLHTLRQMGRGGMNDQLGGGFHRYSVDERWFVPHFEKMLYDQAQLAVSFLEAYQITEESDLAGTARTIFDYVLRDMTHPDGGFYSAEDADSVIDPEHPHEKGEGAFYIWSRKEIGAVLGEPAATWFSHFYGVEQDGNVRNDPHGEFTGRNILYQATGIDEAAQRFGVTEADLAASLSASASRLMQVRPLRVRPHLDDKILTGWNGMMIAAFALGGQVLAEPRYTAAARRAADFVLAKLYDPGTGLLLRRYRDGEAAIPGFLDDYALFADALATVYESCFEPAYLAASTAIAERMIRLFEDTEEGGFYSTAGDDASLILRMKDDYDGAEPSGNSSAVSALLRLAAITGRADFEDAASRAIRAFAQRLRVAPHATPRMAAAYLDYQANKPRQIVLAGDSSNPDFQALAAEVWKRFLPGRVLLHANQSPVAMPTIEGRATAYVCHNFACELPVQEPAQLARLLH